MIDVFSNAFAFFWSSPFTAYPRSSNTCVMLGTAPVVRSRVLSRLGSSRAFVCEGPDAVVRYFWWRRLEQGNYDVSRSISPYLPLAAYVPWCPSLWDCFCCCLGFFLQLYAAHEPFLRIGLFRKHHPPERLPVGDNYATFSFSFLHRPLLVNALLALSLNRWLDSQVGQP